MHLFNRSKLCNVQLIGEDLVVRAIYLDSVHEMVLDVVANPQDLMIKKVEAEMVRAPYPLCQAVKNKVQGLEGLQIGHGMTRLVHEKIGGAEGCVHLSDLFMDVSRALVTAQYAWLNEISDEEAMEKVIEELKGTCYAYSHEELKEAINC